MNNLPWADYSKKFSSRIENPCCGGMLSEKEALERSFFLAIGMSGAIATGNKTMLYFFVDTEGGDIRDARFQAYGDSAFLGACEVICELAVGKTYLEASRLTIDDIDQHVRDKKEIPSFPKNTHGHITLALYALQDAMEECTHIPLPIKNSPFRPKTDIPTLWTDSLGTNWEKLSHENQLHAIEQVLSEDVRPVISQDSGGVNVISLQGTEVTITYTGACASCMSSTGSTLSYIQSVLRTRIHPNIQIRIS